MSDQISQSSSSPVKLILGLNDKPSTGVAFLAAIAHLFAIAASILTAPLLLARAIGLDDLQTVYVINASLGVSGIATFIQVYKFGWLGSGLLSVQGTSFAFIGAMAYASSILKDTMQIDEVVGVLLGTSIIGGGLVILASFFLAQIRKIITPTVTGVTIFLLGISLLISALTNLTRVYSSAADIQQSMLIISEAMITLLIIIVLATRRNIWCRLLSIPSGLLVGFLIAAAFGDLNPPPISNSQVISILVPFRFPLGFDFLVLILLLPIFLVSLTETIGDITASSSVSELPIEGKSYLERLRGGVMADGVNTILASCFGAFPNTTFSQNNAVIKVTGIASRRVGLVLAGLLVLLGAIPLISEVFMRIPGGVLNAATGFLFGMIALTGLQIVLHQKEKRALVVLLLSFAIALALMSLPGALSRLGLELPAYLVIILGFPVATGTIIAIFLELFRKGKS